MTGIVFDIDDTLYCRQDMLVKAAESVLKTSIDDSLDFISIFYKNSDINMQDLESGRISTRDINGWRYEETFKEMELPYHAGDGVLTADAYLELQSHMCLSDDMIRVLDSLSADSEIKLAILTAGESEHQRHKLDLLGLYRWFDNTNIIVSGETGFSKPDVRLFKIIEERLGLKPDKLWMIGDSYKHDIIGALASGWHTIWINRRGLPEPDKMPDFKVTSDKELTSILQSVFK